MSVRDRHTQLCFQSLRGSSYFRHPLQRMLPQDFWPPQEEVLSLNYFQHQCKALSDEGGTTTLQSLPHSRGCRLLFWP